MSEKVPLRKVIDTVVGSLCTPFATEGGTGFLCTRGPRPVTDTLECGHEVTSYNGQRPRRKCPVCQPGDLPRRAAVSQDRDRLIVLIAETGGWRVEVTPAGQDEPDTVARFDVEDDARRYANAAWRSP